MPKQISNKTLVEIMRALHAASLDIHESLQLFVRNATGKSRDGFFYGIPKPPLTAHAEGIKKSERVEAQVDAALGKLIRRYRTQWSQSCQTVRKKAGSR